MRRCRSMRTRAGGRALALSRCSRRECTPGSSRPQPKSRALRASLPTWLAAGRSGDAGGGSADGRVRLRQRGRRSNVGCTLNRRHGLRAVPGSETGSLAHPREKVAADAVCITRCQTFRADSHAHVAGKDLGRGSFQGNTEPERTLQFLAALHSPISPFPSCSLLLSLSLSLLNLFLCLSHPALPAFCRPARPRARRIARILPLVSPAHPTSLFSSQGPAPRRLQ